MFERNVYLKRCLKYIYAHDGSLGKKEAEKQKELNDEMKNEMGTLYSSKPADKRWKQIDDHFKTLIEYGEFCKSTINLHTTILYFPNSFFIY